LVRIVIKDRSLTTDKDKRLPGRGAYLCPRRECADLLLKKKGRFSHALRAALLRDEEKVFLQGLLFGGGTEEER
jgi:predicted RNA-binding protein YlxR (DUF448 family)